MGRFLLVLLVWSGARQTGAQETQRTFEFESAVVEEELEQPSGEIIFTASRGVPRSERDQILARADITPLRRAQLLLQRADASAMAAYELEDRSMGGNLQMHDADEAARLRAESEAALQRSKADVRRAVEVLEQHLRVRRRPYTRETGVAMWTWLHAAQQLEEHEDATRIAQLFVAECSDCPLVVNAHVLLADRAFERMDMPTARVAYLAATSVRRASPETRAYAYYKLGWLHLNLGAFEDSLAAFREVRTLSADSTRTGVMHREAGRDYVRVLGMTTGRDAIDLIEAIRTTATEPEASALLDRLEEQLRDAGRTAEADALAAAR